MVKKHIKVVTRNITILLIIGLVQCITHEEKQKLKKVQLECVDETNVNPDLVLELKTGKWNQNHIAIKKWALCVLVKSGVMSQEAVFKVDEALSHVPPEYVDLRMSEIEKCLSKRRREPHEIAWLYLKCLNKKHPRQILVI